MTGFSERELIDIVAALYEAAIDESRWPTAWSLIGARMARASSTFFVVDEGTQQARILGIDGVSDKAAQLYADHYRLIDPFLAFENPGARNRMIAIGSEIISPRDFERSEFWVDYLRPHVGAYHFLVASVALDSTQRLALGFQRPRDAPEFGTTERRDLELLLPHIKRSIQLQAQMAADRISLSARTALLEQLEFGALVLDGQSRVIFENSATKSICAASGVRLWPVFAVTGHVRADDERLGRLIADALSGGPGGSLKFRPADKEWIEISISRLPEALLERSNMPLRLSREHLLVLIRPLAREPASTNDLIALFGLTPSEAAVARELASGLSVQAVADRRKTSVFTIRSQIRQILMKTGADNLRNLVARLSQLAMHR
jgi:DNA-binding CsgD family transcriptional regulator